MANPLAVCRSLFNESDIYRSNLICIMCLPRVHESLHVYACIYSVVSLRERVLAAAASASSLAGAWTKSLLPLPLPLVALVRFFAAGFGCGDFVRGTVWSPGVWSAFIGGRCSVLAFAATSSA